jgi:NAD(P)-dependent dehydrogenase (short-subunit alcohol dehydrogenase family)
MSQLPTVNERGFEPEQLGLDIRDSVTIITGGARGIGRATALALLKLGGRVAICDINEELLDRTSAELREISGERALAGVADCTQRNDIDAVVAQAVDRFGRVDNLVYCAGAYRASTFLEVDGEQWDVVLDSNLKGAFLAAQSALPAMIEAGGGSVVNISSIAGRSSSPFLGCHYSSAKAGILGLTRHAAREFGGRGVRFNAVCPGAITGARMTEFVTELNREGDLEAMADATPLGRNAVESDIVGVILFLLSSLSSFVNGATIDVNGGILAT